MNFSISIIYNQKKIKVDLYYNIYIIIIIYYNLGGSYEENFYFTVDEK